MSKILFIFATALLLWPSSEAIHSAATRTLNGTVTDASNATPLAGVTVLIKGTTTGTTTDSTGHYTLSVPTGKGRLVFSYIGYLTREVSVGARAIIDVKLHADVRALSEVVVNEKSNKDEEASQATKASPKQQTIALVAPPPASYEQAAPAFNTEEYDAVRETGFVAPKHTPLSTFSIDVDAASYSNVRRFLNNGQAPPKDAVRIEEMVNYFSYDYHQPTGEAPFSVNTELSQCPWANGHYLLHIGLQGKTIPTENLPPSNLVFLVDVSGSMDTPEKLPLLKAAFRLLTEQLRPQDHVAIVVYAGAAGLVLPPTPGNRKSEILAALERLQAGGSTAGGEGIALAYRVAQQHFRQGGNNRVILATDGDFNVGESSNAAMERLVEQERASNIFLTVLGFGMGNYKDSKMETLADKGNGNYAYIDTILEARKVLVNEFGGTLFTIAKDVKLQLEFNPARVKAYRLIGYENRALKSEDFNNDAKDAGELGSGHTVTALYEIIPANSTSEREPFPSVDPLKYQQNRLGPKAGAGDWLTLKLRYKAPDSNQSRLLETTVRGQARTLAQSSDNFRFSAAVAAYGMLLHDSEFKGQATYAEVLRLAQGARGRDEEGYRIEFINLVKSSQLLVAKK